MPGLLVILVFGLLFPADIDACLIAFSGAFTVGFGAFKKLSDYPPAPMLIVAIGICTSAWLGSLAGNFFPLLLLLAVLWAIGCALVSAVDNTAWWIVQQWTVALVVAGNYAGGLETANERALLLLLGAAVEMLGFQLFHQLIRQPRTPLSYTLFRANLNAIRNNLEGQVRLGRYAVYIGSVIFLSMLIIQLLGLGHGYWAPLAALSVLKLDLRETRSKGAGRLLGTLGGCLLAMPLAHAIRDPQVLVAVTLACVFLAYTLQNARYSLFCLFLSASVLLMLAIGGSSEWQASYERLLATLIGGGLAILVVGFENRLLDRLHPQ